MATNPNPTLQEATRGLFDLMDLSDYLKVIADGIYRSHEWNTGASQSRGDSFENENVATEKALHDVWVGLQLMVNLTRIYEASQLEEKKGGSND